MKTYECKSCGAITATDYFKSPFHAPWCPVCRGRTIYIGEEQEEKFSFFECPSCGIMFGMVKGIKPHKCAGCNYTFPVTPYRKQTEKL